MPETDSAKNQLTDNIDSINMDFNQENIRSHLSKITSQLPVVFLLFALVLVVIPSFDLLTWAIAYDEKRIFEIGILFITAGGTLFSRQSLLSFLESFLSLPTLTRQGLFVILILGIASSMLAFSPRHAFLELCLFGLLFSFAISVSALTRRYPSVILVIVFSALLSSIFFYEIIFFSGYIGSLIQSFPFDTRILFANFANVRFLNQFQIWTLPLIVLPLLLYREKLNSRLFVFILLLGIFWWVIVFASRGRGIQLAILAASCLTLIIFRKDAWPLLKWLGISAFSGLISYLLLFVYIPESGQEIILHGVMNDSARMALWSSALTMIQENPLLGVGPQHYAYYQQTIANHPHNSLLQIAAEWGVPVAIFVVTLFIWGAISWCRKFYDSNSGIRTNEKKHLWIALFCSATAGLAYSMVSGVIVMPLSQIMFAAVIGMMLGLYRNTAPDSIPNSKISLLMIRLALASMIIYVPVKLAPDIITRLEMPGPPYNSGHIGSYQPRFWQEGDILD